MTNREERERLRAERMAAQARGDADERRRQLLGYGVAGLLIAVVVVGIVVVIASGGDSKGGGGNDGSDAPDNAFIVVNGSDTFNLKPDGRKWTDPPPVKDGNLASAARTAGCEVKTFPDEGNKHIAKLSAKTKVHYKTNPPTSGNHFQIPLADGSYLKMPDPRTFVHALEHGRVEIQYSPKLPEADQLLIKGVFAESPRGMLMFPNTKMPYEVAATAWTHALRCKTYKPSVVDAIRAFRERYRGAGPEQIPY